jgi:chaperonin GroES
MTKPTDNRSLWEKLHQEAHGISNQEAHGISNQEAHGISDSDFKSRIEILQDVFEIIKKEEHRYGSAVIIGYDLHGDFKDWNETFKTWKESNKKEIDLLFEFYVLEELGSKINLYFQFKDFGKPLPPRPNFNITGVRKDKALESTIKGPIPAPPPNLNLGINNIELQIKTTSEAEQALYNHARDVSKNYKDTTPNFEPLGDKVLVKRIEKEHKTAGGILIPDSAQEKPIQGDVISVGEGLLLENGNVKPLKVKVGDKVLFSKYAGTELKLDGVDYLLMSQGDILGIIH